MLTKLPNLARCCSTGFQPSQASTLGALPRMHVVHTGKDIEGQVYIAPVNWILMLLCIAVVAGFQDTTSLGNAYGTVGGCKPGCKVLLFPPPLSPPCARCMVHMSPHMSLFYVSSPPVPLYCV